MKQLYRKFLLVICFCLPTGAAFAAGHTINVVSTTNVLCNGGATGSATVSVSGGVGPFTYSWSPTGGTNATASSLVAGTYTVTATDQNDGSTATATVTIGQPTPISINFSVVHATCGFPNGQVTAIVGGGVAPYTYLWTPSNVTSATMSNLTSGVYTVMVTDANGCVQTASVVVVNNPGPTINSITATPPTICSGHTSVLTPTTSGGTSPFTYNWTNPGGSLNSTTLMSPTASPTTTTTYTMTVTDSNGCASSGTVIVFVNQQVGGTVTPTSATCNQSNGSLTTNITTGTPPFSFLWSTGDTTQSLSNIPAGQYTVTVTDASSCQTTIVSGVSNVGGPSVSISATSASCTNFSNGSVTASATGPAPITYSWNTVPVQTTATVNGINSGIYFVTVTDSAGCITVDSANVAALAGNLFMYASATAPSNCNTTTGSAACYVQGGTAPYSYLWSNGNTTSTVSNLLGGNYSVTVTDANGCSQSGPATIGSICVNVITGRVYIDVNQDSVYNAGDLPLVGKMVSFPPFGLTSTDSQGVYTRYIYMPGPVSAVHNTPYYTLSTPAAGSYSSTFPSLGDTLSGLDFIYHVNGVYQDLYLSLASGVARPGFTQAYSIHCENRGTTAVSDTIWFRHDSILTLISSSPPLDGYTHPQGYWLFSNFQPGQQINKSAVLQVPTINNGGYLGRQLISNARIEPMWADTTSADNGDDELDIIQGSYDPNMKECWSPTMDVYGNIWPTDLTLDYTIHFQNTGTDTAFTVVVVDTLPAELDITTFSIGASSHSCTYLLESYNGISSVTFTFMNILLPDSFVNEPASHGFVQFTIERYPNQPIGTMILNEANNYFDFNLPVVTNTDSVTITDPLGITAPENRDVRIYPNPANESVNILLDESFGGENAVVVLCDISGREIARVNSAGNTYLTLNTEGCAPGLYFITVHAGNGADRSQRLIIE